MATKKKPVQVKAPAPVLAKVRVLPICKVCSRPMDYVKTREAGFADYKCPRDGYNLMERERFE